jgi:hypothetical protein
MKKTYLEVRDGAVTLLKVLLGLASFLGNGRASEEAVAEVIEGLDNAFLRKMRGHPIRQ